MKRPNLIVSRVLFFGSVATLVSACGIKPQASETKIVGGQVAGERLFMAGLVGQGTDSIFCGGTFIAPDVVMTAAHCVSDGWDGLRVSGGVHTSNGLSTEKTAAAKNVIVHENYDAAKNDNDVALVFLNSDELAHFGGKVVPATPSTDSQLPETLGSAIVSGWGVEHEGDFNLPTELREVTVPIITTDKCKTAGTDYANVSQHQVCAGDWDKGGIDSCQGDSGGPLFVEQNGQVQVMGIVSWGIGCAEAKEPGVYTRVAEYTSWISDKVSHR